MIKVKDKHFVEENTGEKLIPWGAWIWGSDWNHRYDSRITDSLDFMKNQGFNTTGTILGWSEFEKTAGKGDYINYMFDRLVDFAQKCKDRDLYCGYGLRLSATSWTNQAPSWFESWSYADRFYPPYENRIRTGDFPYGPQPPNDFQPDPSHSADYYWESFKKLWVKIVTLLEPLDNVFYVPWYYPWHGQDPVTGRWEQPKGKHQWWEGVTPELFGKNGAIRQHTDKMLVWTPVGQGSAWDRTLVNLINDPRNVYITDTLGNRVRLLKNDPGGNTARFDPEIVESNVGGVDYVLNPSAIGLLNNNICFAVNGHKPHNLEKGRCDTPADWRGTELEKEFQYNQFEPGRRFMLRHGVPMMVTEMGYFYYTSCNNKNIWDWVKSGYRHRLEQIVTDPPMSCVYWQFDDGNESILVSRYVNELNDIGLMLKELKPSIINGNGGDNLGFKNELKQTVAVYKRPLPVDEFIGDVEPGGYIEVDVDKTKEILVIKEPST